MRFRIHYEIGGVEDEFVVTGRTVREIRKKANIELRRRGVPKRYAWSTVEEEAQGPHESEKRQAS